MEFRLSPSLKKLIEKNGGILVYLFGSEVTGFYGVRPDVDIAVLLSHHTPPSLNTYLELYKIFSPLFPGKELDLVILNEAPLSLRWEIVNTGKVLWEKKRGLALDYKERVFKEYLDFWFHRERFNRAVKERLV